MMGRFEDERVCPMCRIDEHMLQPRAHPWWDNGELPASAVWPLEEQCGCPCAREEVHRPFVDVHLPPFEVEGSVRPVER